MSTVPPARASPIEEIYRCLLSRYGPQGWWPLASYAGASVTKTGSTTGYHPGDYSYPRTPSQRFEICMGAILTQNVSWRNAERAVAGLARLGATSPGRLLALDEDALRAAIRPAGHYNHKARKLRELASLLARLAGRCPTRDELLGVWGVGEETADSILLYAYAQPSFVVDAYTRRIFANFGMVQERAAYAEVKGLFERSLPRDVALYQEYHALIVEHAKRHYAKKGTYHLCPLYARYARGGRGRPAGGEARRATPRRQHPST